MFTPGDNNWTDCDRPSNGGFNSHERLDHARKVLFSTPYLHGKHLLKREFQTSPDCFGVNGPTPCVENWGRTFQGRELRDVNGADVVESRLEQQRPLDEWFAGGGGELFSGDRPAAHEDVLATWQVAQVHTDTSLRRWEHESTPRHVRRVRTALSRAGAQVPTAPAKVPGEVPLPPTTTDEFAS